MTVGSFCPGQRLTLKGEPYRIHRALGEGMVFMEALTSGRMAEHRISDLLAGWQAGDLVLGDGRPLPDETALVDALNRAHLDAFQQSYTEKEQKIAKAKLVYVVRLEPLPRTSYIMAPAIFDIWEDKSLWKHTFAFAKPPHYTTVARWISAYLKADRDIRALVNRHGQKGNRVSRVDPIVQTMADDLIHTRYLTEERPSIRAILKELKGMVALRNMTRLSSERLASPTYSYLKHRIRDMAPYDVCRARYGQRAADIKFRVAGRTTLALRPLARASMDHTRMDVFVVDERTGLPLGRPWLTLIIDECTRYILGYYLGFEEPGSVSMARALRHALGVKTLMPDVQSTWDAWGLMDTLVVDNGMEFHGRALEAGAGRFGITIQFCPRKKPWFKGKVERFFGTMNTGLLAGLKGKTFSNIFLKGDYDPAKHAVLTLDTLRRVVQTWIVDVYHQEWHTSLQMTPAEAWRQGMETVDQYLPPSSMAVESAFSISTTRRLTHKGIEFDCLLYNSAELGRLRELHGDHLPVEVRTHDDDLGSIIVVAPDGKTLIKVPALESEYACGLTRWQHRVCKRYQRRLKEDEAREIKLLDARRRIRALVEADMQLASRKTRSRQQRFVQQEGANTPPPLSDPSHTSPVDASVPAENMLFTSGERVVADLPVEEPWLGGPDEIPDFPSRQRAQGDTP